MNDHAKVITAIAVTNRVVKLRDKFEDIIDMFKHSDRNIDFGHKFVNVVLLNQFISFKGLNSK